MAQHSLKWTPSPLAQRQLGIDKVSVMLGFVLGLTLGMGTVQEALAAWGASDALQTAGLFAAVALSTFAGARVGAWLTQQSRPR